MVAARAPSPRPACGFGLVAFAPAPLRLAQAARSRSPFLVSPEPSGGRYRLKDMSEFTPTLRVSETAGRVRLGLDGFFSAEGPTLEEAADELVWKLLVAVMAFRTVGISGLSAAGRPDTKLAGVLWELGEIAAAGGDIREGLFGPSSKAA